MSRPWEKKLPFVALVIVGLLVAQVLSLRREEKPGLIYLHTVPSGAKVFFLQAGSAAGFHRKLIGRSPGPLPISLKERRRFTFNLELFGFRNEEALVSREQLADGPVIKLTPRWGLASFIPYHVRDYLYFWLAVLFGASFWLQTVRPRQKERRAQAALWKQGGLRPGMRFHEYRLLEKLGEGAAGAVFRADKPEETTQESYSLKFFHRGDGKQDDELRESLNREFKNCAELTHPNIVYLLDWGVFEGFYYLVSEYVEGKPLDHEPVYSLHDICLWAHQLVNALDYAHSQGIVHRDIKPANIMKTVDNRVKILDFGIAARSDIEEERGAGSIGFMAPEQASGKASAASDLYSLGATLYRLASGRMPFPGEDYFQILAAQAMGKYVPLWELLDNCPQVFTELVDGLLQKEPEERLTDPARIRELLDSALAELKH